MIVLRTFCYFILQITLLLSVLFLLRGHNHPGGGFIAALIACTGIGCYLLSYKKLPQFILRIYILLTCSGLLCIMLSMVIALFYGKNLLTGLWWKRLFWEHLIKLGTPLLFDIGIYLSILGSLVWVMNSLEKNLYD